MSKSPLRTVSLPNLLTNTVTPPSPPVCPLQQKNDSKGWGTFLLDPARKDEMIEKTGRRTVPQIFIGATHVGGFDDLSALDRDGKLTPLLAGTPTGN